MNILMSAVECSPYHRQSVAADAVAALAKTLRQLGHEVTIALPRWPGFEQAGLMLARRLSPLALPGGAEAVVFDVQLPSGVRLALLDGPAQLPEPGADGSEEPERLAWLGLAAAALAAQRLERGQPFDVVHAHDWPAALAPEALRQLGDKAPASVLTLHDVASPGALGAAARRAWGLPEGAGSVVELGVVAADVVTTVGEARARELLAGQRLPALAERLMEREAPLQVLEHGIDYAVYNPATDVALPQRYDAEDSANKGRCKTQLLQALELELVTERPLFVVFLDGLSAAAVQLLVPALLKAELSLLLVPPGEAEALEPKLERLLAKHAERARLLRPAQDAELRRLMAAADLALVAREPLARIAQRYGSVPVVVGQEGEGEPHGVDCDAQLETGTAFVSGAHTAAAVLGAAQRALAAYGLPGFLKLRRRVMRLDLSWDRPARRYVQLYRQALKNPPS